MEWGWEPGLVDSKAMPGLGLPVFLTGSQSGFIQAGRWFWIPAQASVVLGPLILGVWPVASTFKAVRASGAAHSNRCQEVQMEGVSSGGWGEGGQWWRGIVAERVLEGQR